MEYDAVIIWVMTIVVLLWAMTIFADPGLLRAELKSAQRAHRSQGKSSRLVQHPVRCVCDLKFQRNIAIVHSLASSRPTRKVATKALMMMLGRQAARAVTVLVLTATIGMVSARGGRMNVPIGPAVRVGYVLCAFVVFFVFLT